MKREGHYFPGYRSQNRLCYRCGKPIIGFKPYGSVTIYSRRGVIVGTVAWDKEIAHLAYAHIACSETAKPSKPQRG